MIPVSAQGLRLDVAHRNNPALDPSALGTGSFRTRPKSGPFSLVFPVA